ncbi:hypothetical protein [Corynebacterium minutissimum]|uniref:hypothetical protein n=1 Tax=Corynebacterium minutissimum TaxID=38301 RepID=UPI000E0EE935
MRAITSQACLSGVKLPKDWWWALIVITSLAAAAHVRAHFLGSEFWINCLGMLALSTGVLVLTLVLN